MSQDSVKLHSQEQTVICHVPITQEGRKDKRITKPFRDRC